MIMLSTQQCISPEVIILRVITGRAVTTKPAATAPLNTIQFVSAGRPDEHTFGITSSTPSGAISDYTGATTLGGPGSRLELHKEDV